jgi:hypothetical protein
MELRFFGTLGAIVARTQQHGSLQFAKSFLIQKSRKMGSVITVKYLLMPFVTAQDQSCLCKVGKRLVVARKSIFCCCQFGNTMVCLSLHSAPTLGLVGKDDGCVLPSTFRDAMLPEDFPNGLEVIQVENAGHFLQHEQPDTINNHLFDWISKHAVNGPFL